MSPRVPPIESEYRGSRMNTTFDPNNLMVNNSSSHSSINNSNPCRTTYVATNIRSYFSLPNPNNTTEHQDRNQGHRSHHQRRHSARDRHAHRAADGLSPRQLAGSALSLHNLIPALHRFWNALTHQPLSLSWQSTMKAEAPSTAKSGPA